MTTPDNPNGSSQPPDSAQSRSDANERAITDFLSVLARLIARRHINGLGDRSEPDKTPPAAGQKQSPNTKTSRKRDASHE